MSSTSVLRIADILRKLNETCQVASGLRTAIERQMCAADARVKPAKDDTAVLDARKTAHKNL